MASVECLTDFAKILIDNGADINYKNRYDETALLVAAREKHIEMCELLVENGADINVTDKEGNTPFTYVKNRVPRLVELFESKIAESNKETKSG